MRQRPPEQFGPYLIHEVIGIGGMASVHRAETPASGPVALKRMLPQFADNDEAVAAFIREARLATAMRHPNVAQTFDSGRVGDVYFIAMELISGRNLSQLAHAAASAGSPMPLGVTLGLAIQICDALDYAHTLTDAATKQPLGIIHRDVSPSNVIVTDAGVAKLIDFGVAKGAAAGMQTRGITLKGKFAYMGPEYLLGKIDARADLFALGVILHELLANAPLFASDDDHVTMERLRTLVVPPPSRANPAIPPELDGIVLRTLERDPDARFQHAAELRDALGDILRAHPKISATPEAVAAWIVDAFGETLTLGPTTRAPAASDGLRTSDLGPVGLRPDVAPVPVSAEVRSADFPATSLDLAPVPAPHDDEIELAPSPLVVKITPTPVKLDVDDWARDTNIAALVRAGTDLGDPGAQPVSIEEPAKPAAAPAEPEPPRAVAPRPLPAVVVIAPNRRRRIALAVGIAAAVLVALVAAGAALFVALR